MNLDREISEAAKRMQAEVPSPEARVRALAALRRPGGKTVRPLVLKTAGAVAVLLVAGVAMFPSPSGSGAAWAQAASNFAAAPRVHEVMEIIAKDGKAKMSSERWWDSGKYALTIFSREGQVYASRFDGMRQYNCLTFQRFATVQAVHTSPSKIGDMGPFWSQATTLDGLIKNQKASIKSKTTVKLADGREGVRYLVRFGPGSTNLFRQRDMQVDIDPETSRIVGWENISADGPIVRGRVDYPDAIDVVNFKPPQDSKLPLHDLDRERATLASTLRQGVGEVRFGAQKAMVRAVLLDPRNYLTVVWTGASPNGDLKEPFLLPGAGVTLGRAYGVAPFTTSRVLSPEPYAKSTILGVPMGGMSREVKGVLSDTISLKVPIYKEDRTQPLKDKVGRVMGYRSKFLGYSTLTGVHPLKLAAHQYFGPELGLVRAARRK